MDMLSAFKDRKKRLEVLVEQRSSQRRPLRGRALGRIEEVCDPRSVKPLFADILPADPLGFPGYPDKLAALSQRTGTPDAFRCALGTVGKREVVCVELDPAFLMGSMGTAVGEAVCRCAELAHERRAPLIAFSASGGARMQEGMFSLMQMAKTSAAVRRLSEAGVLYISVLTHPTTGGVTASFASLGDVMIAEPGALIGFAGPRVIEQTIGRPLPEGFQRAEFQLANGFVDCVVERSALRATIQHLLELHPERPERPERPEQPGSSAAAATPVDTAPADADAPATHFDAAAPDPAAEATVTKDSVAAPSKTVTYGTPRSPHEHVAIARDARRPHMLAFVEALFDGFVELHGDRLFRDDRALVGGLARFEGMPVTVAGHLKGSDLNSNIARNFGMPHPEGYRKFLRLAHQAEKFSRPLVTFIDTPGAYPGAEAEERGQGEAIARCLFELSALRTPIVAIVTGEGGSGGALALGLADHVVMLEYAVYSVISPEGFASILWKDSTRASEASEVMRLTAHDLHGFGMVDAVVSEAEGGMHNDPGTTIEELRSVLRAALSDLTLLSCDELLERRYDKYRRFR
ncbi:MAG: acetyl-CoA carboxylase carboxyltransferase subunit alpha [Coriobacteriales bacterium]|jgi:acetyl-CoA carboxylase carboxyl transferase subunit beta|nr:acetyl-CoA carboxylase carboxyltransferase subunit alpha [Coriobacteriales bacterium]